MRITFLGNHTVGVRVLEVLAEKAELVGIVAHPEDAEDGVRYESVYEWATAHKIPAIRGKATAAEVTDFIKQTKPDLLWVADYRYLLPSEILKLPKHGTINFHPSLLPKYRGRAPVNWAILKGEKEFGLTAHFIDEGMDTGDILAQEKFYLNDDEDIADALNKLYPLYQSITRNIVDKLKQGSLRPTKQDHTLATAYPARKPQDGLIDWSKSARDVLNLVRAVAAPYPGAYTHCNGTKLIIQKAKIAKDESSDGKPGYVADCGKSSLHIKCGQGSLDVTLWETEKEKCPPVEKGTTLS